MLRKAAIRKYATSVTTSGDRSIPETGGSHRRTGARTGSVTWNANLETAFVGRGFVHEKSTRTIITMMNAYSA